MPTGTCPECGKSIAMHASGWWSHDGMPDGCWRLSMDGPAEEEVGELDTEPLAYA